MRKFSTLETSLVGLACTLVFALCGLILRGWYVEVDGLRGRVGSAERQLHDLERDVVDQRGDIDWLRQRRKDDLREKKEAAMLDERRQWRKDFNAVFEHLATVLADRVAAPQTAATDSSSHGGPH